MFRHRALDQDVDENDAARLSVIKARHARKIEVDRNYKDRMRMGQPPKGGPRTDIPVAGIQLNPKFQRK